MYYIIRLIFLLSLSFICLTDLISDDPEPKEKQKPAIGFNYGYGKNLNDPDYSFQVNFFKIQIYNKLHSGWLDYELLIQPEINLAHHKLLNIWFVQPDTPNYLEMREIFSQRRAITEVVLSFGIVIRKNIGKSFSTYLLGSIGPMYGSNDTERLAKGFSFSDNIALGLSHKSGRISIDFRAGLRHNSNADIKIPNSGHNTINLEFGISYQL